MENLARAFSPKENGEDLLKNGPLSLPIMYVSDGAAIRVFDGCNSRDTDLFMILWSHCQGNG